jgi:predicted DNA binding CopG/RHH family protein
MICNTGGFMIKSRTNLIQVRINEFEKTIIKNKAESIGVSITDYIRECCIFSNVTAAYIKNNCKLHDANISKISARKDILQVRLNTLEKSVIKNKASFLGITMADYVRECCMFNESTTLFIQQLHRGSIANIDLEVWKPE